MWLGIVMVFVFLCWFCWCVFVLFGVVMVDLVGCCFGFVCYLRTAGCSLFVCGFGNLALGLIVLICVVPCFIWCFEWLRD